MNGSILQKAHRRRAIALQTMAARRTSLNRASVAIEVPKRVQFQPVEAILATFDLSDRRVAA